MVINGKEVDFEPGITVSEILEKMNITHDRVVVEINFEILPREKFKGRKVTKDDKIEIISFVGGG